MFIDTLAITPKSRTLTIAGELRRLRLAEGTWAALDQIAEREGMTVDEIVTCVHERAHGHRLCQNLEVFVVAYFQAAGPGLQGAKPVCLM